MNFLQNVGRVTVLESYLNSLPCLLLQMTPFSNHRHQSADRDLREHDIGINILLSHFLPLLFLPRPRIKLAVFCFLEERY